MLEPLTIKERVQILYDSLIERAQKDEAFSEVFRENRNKLISALNAIVAYIDEPNLNSDASELRNEEKLKLEIRQVLNKAGLTFVNKFSFDDLMHIEQYPGLYFIFSQLKDNKIQVKCKFSKADLYESYCKYFDDATYVDFDFGFSYGSADVNVVSTTESTLEDLAENTTKVAEKVKNLAQVFDTDDKLNGGN